MYWPVGLKSVCGNVFAISTSAASTRALDTTLHTPQVGFSELGRFLCARTLVFPRVRYSASKIKSFFVKNLVLCGHTNTGEGPAIETGPKVKNFTMVKPVVVPLRVAIRVLCGANDRNVSHSAQLRRSVFDTIIHTISLPTLSDIYIVAYFLREAHLSRVATLSLSVPDSWGDFLFQRTLS